MKFLLVVLAIAATKADDNTLPVLVSLDFSRITQRAGTRDVSQAKQSLLSFRLSKEELRELAQRHEDLSARQEALRQLDIVDKCLTDSCMSILPTEKAGGWQCTKAIPVECLSPAGLPSWSIATDWTATFLGQMLTGDVVVRALALEQATWYFGNPCADQTEDRQKLLELVKAHVFQHMFKAVPLQTPELQQKFLPHLKRLWRWGVRADGLIGCMLTDAEIEAQFDAGVQREFPMAFET